MDLAEYFEKQRDSVFFATADSEGKVNVAALSRPTMMDDGTAAFLMAGHLDHTICSPILMRRIILLSMAAVTEERDCI